MRSRSPSPEKIRCVFARVNPSGDPPISQLHQSVYLQTSVNPATYQFLTKTYPKGEFRSIGIDEQLDTVILESSLEIIGILDDQKIFHGIYVIGTERVKLLNRTNEHGMVFDIMPISMNERSEFSDGYLHRFLVLVGLIN